MSYLCNLNFPVDEIDRHMRNLRTMYSKVLRTYSGAGVDALTPRQKEIRELCHFLKNYMRIKEGISNLDPIVINNDEDEADVRFI